MLSVGDPAPDFELSDHRGLMVRLRDYRGRKPVVVYFYPKDETPGCTAEACAFRDAYEDFLERGAEVMGISSDSVKSHQNFADKHRLPFHLLSDASGEIRARFGVPKTLGLIPGRVTYVIDREGLIRAIFRSQLRVREHVGKALAALR